ncbi:MAG: hypothetical protein ACKOKC_17330, partial [Chthoniobacterales bacterium]
MKPGEQCGTSSCPHHTHAIHNLLTLFVRHIGRRGAPSTLKTRLPRRYFQDLISALALASF